MNQIVAEVADRVLEATVVGSFTRIGPAVRSRVFDWDGLDELPRLHGKVVLVTGGTSGLGEATARSLARLGASVRILARNPAKAAAAEARIRVETGNDDVRSGIADLSSLGSVARFAEQFAAEHDRLDVLVHNAGALLQEHQRTEDGLEVTVQTQVVAPYLLTNRLLPLLRATAPSRVVWVTSGGLYTQRLSVDDLEMTPDDFDGATAYARAKRAQLALVHHAATALSPLGVTVHAMHPGWAATPGVEAALPRFNRVLGPLLRSPEEGADTIVWLSAADEPAAHPGALWLDRRRRAEHKVRWTRRRDEAAETLRLVGWCEDRVASVG